MLLIGGILVIWEKIMLEMLEELLTDLKDEVEFGDNSEDEMTATIKTRTYFIIVGTISHLIKEQLEREAKA